jgi:hypothetical protein
MAALIKRAMGVLVIAALLSAAPFAIGCDGGDGGSKRAVKWTVERAINPKSVRLIAVVEVCIAPVRLERPIIEYSGNRVDLELRRTQEEGEESHDGCFPTVSVLHKTVTFERDLSELLLFDASTDPPEQRWPRRQ